MRQLIGLLLGAALMTGSAGAGLAQDTNNNGSVKQSAKQAGRDTKQAAKSTGRTVKRGSKKAVNKTAKATRKGAGKVEQKTK
jgi:hypothetical protein